MCNLLLILGLMAVLRPIKVDKDARNIHIPVSFFVSLLVLLMGLGIFYGEKGVINKIDGIILIILSIAYFIYPIIIEIRDIVGASIARPQNKSKIYIPIIYILIGIISLKYGGDFVVDYSIQIARMLNISERVIGLTIVAIRNSTSRTCNFGFCGYKERYRFSSRESCRFLCIKFIINFRNRSIDYSTKSFK